MKKVHDFYFHKAKKENFAARSVYKLEEIDKKFGIFKKGQKVLDLGSSPGSWLQYLSSILGTDGLVVGIDLNELGISFPGNVRFFQADVFEQSTIELISPFSSFDAVISDMAPKTTGNKTTDSERSFQLCSAAIELADKFLKSNGILLVKSLQGIAHERLLAQFKERYQIVKNIKPKSSRSESKELFVLGKNRKIIENK